MAISDDWHVDFIAKVISHVDGVLNYDSGSGTQPTIGSVIRGSTTGALGKILSRTGTAASGSFTLTDVEGRFQDDEALVWCDRIAFDGVVNNGFEVGDTITGATSGRSGVVRKIEYNMTSTGGWGIAWSEQFGTGSWTDNENIQVGGQTRAQADGTGEDNSGAWTGAQVNETTGTITPPSGSDCAIINFDGGTEAIPRFCKIQNTDTASPTKTAIVQKVYGATATGSLRIIDTTGSAWVDNDEIYVQKIPYDNLQSGQKFKVGDKIVTKATPGGAVQASGKIIVVETITPTTGKITLMNQTGTFTDNHRIEVRTTTDTYVADINAPSAGDFQDKVADVDGAEITNQLASQGGIYNGGSLNIVRDSNALYTFLQDQFDELGALDDTVPMSAQVALQQFTLINGWKIPDLSYRFLESGSIQDSGLDNIWTNYQTLGSVEGIDDTVYAAITPLPQFYIEQNGSVISPWWITGHIDVLVKVKTNTNPTLTANADGVLINNGTVTVFNRNYGDTYDHFQTTTIAGVAPVPLATSNDLNNTTGTHSFTFTGTGGQLLVVGEEIVATTPNDPTRRGIITEITTSNNQASGTVSYILTGSTQFANGNTITGQRSGVAKTLSAAPSSLVAGYGSRIVVATIKGYVTYTGGSGTFINGEQVSQAVTGATAIMMHDDTTNSRLYLGNVNGTFSGNNTITGATSGATKTFTSGSSITSQTTINRDIGDGDGNQPYNAVIYLNRDNQANGDTLARMYEWIKYRTRSLETTGEPPYNLLGGPGTSNPGVQGRLYTTLSSAYALIKSSPLGTFAGGTFFGARGVFVQNMDSSDIRDYQLIDANGIVRNPPNQQTLSVTGVLPGDRVAVFRTSGGVIQVDEFTVASFTGGDPYNGAGDTIIRVAAGSRSVSPLPSDIPSTGVVRVRNASTQLYESFTYTSVNRTANEFTVSPLASSLTAGQNVFVPLIEEQATSTSVSKNIIYVSDIPILTRVRIKGILPFEVSGTFGSSGATVAAIRSFDSIVD